MRHRYSWIPDEVGWAFFAWVVLGSLLERYVGLSRGYSLALFVSIGVGLWLRPRALERRPAPPTMESWLATVTQFLAGAAPVYRLDPDELEFARDAVAAGRLAWDQPDQSVRLPQP
jgi:hypothetical protein